MTQTVPHPPPHASASPSENHRDTIRRSLGDAEEYERTAELFQVLGDPNRLRLIAALAARELNVGDLSLIVGIGQSATSHALRILRDRGIAQATRAGQQVRYQLASKQIHKLLSIAWRHAVDAEPPEALRPHHVESDEGDGKKKKKKKKKHRRRAE